MYVSPFLAYRMYINAHVLTIHLTQVSFGLPDTLKQSHSRGRLAAFTQCGSSHPRWEVASRYILFFLL